VKESFEAGSTGATACPVEGVEILLAESVFPSLEDEGVRFDEPAVAVISDVEHCEVARGLHDDIAKV